MEHEAEALRDDAALVEPLFLAAAAGAAAQTRMFFRRPACFFVVVVVVFFVFRVEDRVGRGRKTKKKGKREETLSR